jgi:hypothetical protein
MEQVDMQSYKVFMTLYLTKQLGNLPVGKIFCNHFRVPTDKAYNMFWEVEKMEDLNKLVLEKLIMN